MHYKVKLLITNETIGTYPTQYKAIHAAVQRKLKEPFEGLRVVECFADGDAGVTVWTSTNVH